MGLGTRVSSIQNPARPHCATLCLGAGALNEAPWGCMGQGCVAQQTPLQAGLVFGTSLSWGQKATPNKWPGIPYAHWWGRHGFMVRGLAGSPSEKFPCRLEMLQYFFGELRQHISHFHTWGIANSCSNALGGGIKSTTAGGKLQSLLT